MNYNISRRVSLFSLVAGLLVSSCAGTRQMRLPNLSAAEMLNLLKSAPSTSALIDAVGWGGVVFSFDYNNPDSSYPPFRRPKDEWSRLHIFSRPDLLDRTYRGMEMRSFAFYYNQPINPTSGMIAIFSDENGNIVGWLYSKTLVGHESEAMLR